MVDAGWGLAAPGPLLRLDRDLDVGYSSNVFAWSISQRFRRSHAECNAEMSTRQLRRYCELAPSSRRSLDHAVARLGLSARGYDRVLKVSRTIADLARK